MKGTDFLQGFISEASEMNQSIHNWIDSGLYAKKPMDFLSNWLSNEIEEERKGRTFQQVIIDLVDELNEIRKKNEIGIFLANSYLNSNTASKFDGLAVMSEFKMSDKIEEVMKAMSIK